MVFIANLQRRCCASVIAATLLLALTLPLSAEPFANVGDLELRHDLEYLADRRHINIPITSWPMSWVDIASAIDSVTNANDMSGDSIAVLNRVRKRVAHNSQWGVAYISYGLSASGNRSDMRTFDDTPRSQAELYGTLDYTGRSFAGKLDVTVASRADDGKSLRLDGSFLGVTWGNYIVTAGMQERWWGPGHAGSLVLSSNARPTPGLTINRKVALPFKSKWLSWMGPWSAQALATKLESDRDVSSPYLLGLRLVFKPFRSLELGLTRSAQWGGEGRPEDFESLIDLLLGNDNRSDALTGDREPGNQIAGIDWRYSSLALRRPLTFYGQMMGEDEAGGFPSRYMGLLGLATSMPVTRWPGTLRLNMEYSDTTCQFYESSRLYNCAYNHSIYTDGYRYRGRSIGHSTDNDSRQLALIATYNNDEYQNWSAMIRAGTLNRGGATDVANTLSSMPADFYELDLTHSRAALGGHVDVGVSFRNREPYTSSGSDSDVGLFVKWRSSGR